ncbi:glycosyl hydrolase family 28 protein [Persicobacter psychrovividus]|uniref:Glycosyl hydrolase family 28 n=1 Tax=Persicobacter psychrovividus TaxID=387638 RepID=A0ABM7VJV4_9BACT|nr:hypothetical protein PEPS_35490 [Persicobacter psychrovividus]
MKYTFIIMLVLVGMVSTSLANDLQLYHYPKNTPEHKGYQVKVDHQACFVYQTPVAGIVSFATTQGELVTVVPDFEFKAVKIRPSNLNIKTKRSGNSISFIMPVDKKISLEFDDRIYDPLFIFSQRPAKKNQSADIIYKAGVHYKIGMKRVKSNQKIWIQGGAVVEGSFIMEGVENVHLFGHGVVDNRNLDRQQGYYGFGWFGAKNSIFENITLIGNPRWSTSYFGCKNITANDVRIIGWRRSDDGIDIVGSEDITIKNAFVRTKDDCIAIKSSTFWYKKPAPENINFTTPTDIGCKRTKNIVIDGGVFWNADWGNAIEIGFETRADVMEDITIKNANIIRVEGNGGVFSIHNGDRAVVQNVVYKNIHIEEAYGYLCHFQILHSHYSKDAVRGSGKGIYLENIQVKQTLPLNSLITGLNKNHTYDGVHFDNLQINGRKVMNLKDGGIYTEFADNVTFK